MRTLQRNKRPAWFCLFLGVSEVVDADGNYTGEYDAEYAPPQKVMVNISPATGKDAIEVFGTDEMYDKMIVVDWSENVVFSPNDYDGLADDDGRLFGVGMIDNNTVWFIDHAPTDDSLTKHDYIIKKIAKSINNICIAVQKINNE